MSWMLAEYKGWEPLAGTDNFNGPFIYKNLQSFFYTFVDTNAGNVSLSFIGWDKLCFLFSDLVVQEYLIQGLESSMHSLAENLVPFQVFMFFYFTRIF